MSSFVELCKTNRVIWSKTKGKRLQSDRSRLGRWLGDRQYFDIARQLRCVGFSFTKPKRWWPVCIWPIIELNRPTLTCVWQDASISGSVIGSASGDALCARALAILRSSTFLWLRPCAAITDYCLRRFACSPALTVDILWLIQSILLNLLVVAVCVNTWTSNYVICAVAADGDNVFEA